MTWRKGHGAGKGVPRIEVLPPDELPQPIVPATLPENAGPIERTSDGRVADSAAAKALGSKGGLAKAKKREALRGLGLLKLEETSDFYPYWKMSEEWIKDRLIDLAGQAGGYLGPAPTSMVVNAGRLYYAGLYYEDLAIKMGGRESLSIFTQASTLKERSRIQNMAAYEMAVREAKARLEQQNNGSPYVGLLEAADADNDE